MSLFPELDDDRQQADRAELLKTFSYRRPAYEAPVRGPHHPATLAYWAGADIGRQGLPRPSTPYDTDDLTRQFIDGYRFGALCHLRAPQGTTRTRSGHRAKDDITRSRR